MRTLPKQSGFSLLEVLVTLVIVSVGLLGVAGLQVTGMRFNTISAQRSIASIEINNFITKMRANLCGVQNTNPALEATIGQAYPTCTSPTDDAFSYKDFSSEAPLPTGYTQITVPGTTCTTAGTRCSSSAQAAADLWGFAQNVANRLVAGSVRVTCNDDLTTGTAGDCTNSSTYRVTVFWQEGRSVLDAQGQTIATGAAVPQQFYTVFLP